MGILINNPAPLRSCPTLPVWEKRRGQTYLVFIDETFLNFFDLRSDGYFCHAAVGLPEGEYGEVRDGMMPIFDRYCELLVPQREFKHTEFKRIEFEERLALAKAIRDLLYDHGAFISAFYTPAGSFLMEQVRVGLYLEGVEESIPSDYRRLTELMERAAAEVKTAWVGPGMSDIIAALLHTPISGLLHFCEAIDAKIRVVYDPRERKEDKAVMAAIHRIADLVGRITPATAGRLLEVNITSKSEEEIGLQLGECQEFCV